MRHTHISEGENVHILSLNVEYKLVQSHIVYVMAKLICFLFVFFCLFRCSRQSCRSAHSSWRLSVSGCEKRCVFSLSLLKLKVRLACGESIEIFNEKATPCLKYVYFGRRNMCVLFFHMRKDLPKLKFRIMYGKKCSGAFIFYRPRNIFDNGLNLIWLVICGLSHMSHTASARKIHNMLSHRFRLSKEEFLIMFSHREKTMHGRKKKKRK